MSSISRWRSGLTGAARIGSFIVRLLSVEGSRNALLAPDGAQSRRIARVTSRTSIHAPSREAGSFFGLDPPAANAASQPAPDDIANLVAQAAVVAPASRTCRAEPGGRRRGR